MSKRQARIVVLCEDKQQEVFFRRYLKDQGHRHLRSRVAPRGGGAAEQFVRDRYPAEVKAHRSNVTHQLRLGLLTAIDADEHLVADRHQELTNALVGQGLAPRAAAERIAVLVPKRNIETWIHFLLGQPVDEQTDYPKLAQRERDCQPAVEALKRHLKTSPLPQHCPNSLQLGVAELLRIE